VKEEKRAWEGFENAIVPGIETDFRHFCVKGTKNEKGHWKERLCCERKTVAVAAITAYAENLIY